MTASHLAADVVGFGVREDRLERGHHRRHLFGGDLRADVTHDMHPAALPPGAGELLGDGTLEPRMRIRGHQVYPGQAPGP